jgi:hypothetical protein
MTPVTNRPRWITWTGGGLIAYAVLFTLYTLLQPLGETGRLIVGDIVYIPSSLAAGILSLLVLRVTDDCRLRWAWGLIGLGFISWALADTLWAWDELVLGILPESPHLTDVFYLLMYPLFFAGLLVYPTVRWDRLSRTKLLLDVSVIAIAAGMFSWHSLIAPMLSAESDSLLGRIIEVAYPIADLILLWGLLRVYFATPQTMTRAPIVMLMIGIGLNVIADVWYALLSAYDLYYTGHIVDALWVIGSVIAAGAALAQVQALRLGAHPRCGFSPAHRDAAQPAASPLRGPGGGHALPGPDHVRRAAHPAPMGAVGRRQPDHRPDPHSPGDHPQRVCSP